MFRRRKAEVDPADEAESGAGGAAEPAAPRAGGPWDASEVSLEEDDETRIDLGSLLLTPPDTLDVQLQVDEHGGEVIGVLVAREDAAAELRAFAAPRNGDIWESIRTRVAAEVAQLGGTATERQGPFGTELAVSLMVDLPDGQSAQQQSVVMGIPGPRWLLRVTLFGRPAVAYDAEGDVERAVRDVVVVRGGDPVPPGDALPLSVPAHAERVDPPTA